MTDFVLASPKVNALADCSPGFVWRYESDETESFNINPFGKDLMYANLSVWEDLASLKHFVYETWHAEVAENQKKWFHPLKVNYVLWWIKANSLPTLEEGVERSQYLEKHGPSPYAFNFKTHFASPKK